MEKFEPRSHTPDAVDLFSFSAAVWLLHRIHYDQQYTTTVEGHPGLLVHGPLQAVYLSQAIRRHFGPKARLVRFRFRHQAPAYLGDTLTCHGEVVGHDADAGITTCDVWIELPDGRKTTMGVAEVAVG